MGIVAMASYETVQEAIVEVLAEDENLRGLTYEERRRLLLKMRIFQMGISVMGFTAFLIFYYVF